MSKTAEVSTRTLFLSSGNNVEPVRDMTRRTITIILDPACEIPAARNFLKQPVNEVQQNRAYYISLVLVIIRAWICAGMPKTNCKAIASYCEWSDYCRQSLLWLGLPDPVNCIFEAMNNDPDRGLLGDFLEAWYDKFGKKATLVKEVVSAAQDFFNGKPFNELLHEVVLEIAGERDQTINRKRLGWWIKRHAGRIVNGLRFVEDDTTRNATKWKVESV